MKDIGYIVKNNNESKKVQDYLFRKGGRWNIRGKTFYIVPIGKYGTLITLHDDKYLGFFQIEELSKLKLAYELFNVRIFGRGKLKI